MTERCEMGGCVSSGLPATGPRRIHTANGAEVTARPSMMCESCIGFARRVGFTVSQPATPEIPQ